MPRLALIGLAAVLLMGCGGDSSHSSATAQATSAAPTQGTLETGPGRFRGQARSTYDDAKTVCGAFAASKVATDLGLPPSAARTSDGLVKIAEMYAADYNGDQHQPAFEGCLDALPNPSG